VSGIGSNNIIILRSDIAAVEIPSFLNIQGPISLLIYPVIHSIKIYLNARRAGQKNELVRVVKNSMNFNIYFRFPSGSAGMRVSSRGIRFLPLDSGFVKCD
jgi:hypothetical protein